MSVLIEAAKRFTAGYPGVNEQCESDTIALATFAAELINAMPNLDGLPEGPWRYMPMEHTQVCEQFGFGSPEWKVGPAKARAIAMLLIWAERQAAKIGAPQ